MRKIVLSTLLVSGLLVWSPTIDAGAFTVPSAPETVLATAGDTTIEVSWSAPTTDGGSTVTGYTAYAFPVPTVVAGGSGSGSGLDQLSWPGGLAVATDGTVYVSDSLSRVVRWAPGAAVGELVAGGNGAGYNADQLASTAIGLDRGIDGALYIVDRALNGADPAGDRVVRWVPGESAGTVVAGGNGRGGSPNQLSQPVHIAVAADGTQFIGSYNSIGRWTVGAVSGSDLGGTPNLTYGLAFEGSDLLQLQDRSISRWTPSGGGFTQTPLVFGTGAWGTGLHELGQEYYPPSGLAIDGDGDVYIGDTGFEAGGNHRIVRWTPGDAEATLVYADLSTTIFDLAIDGSGALYGTDQTGHRVVRFDLAGNRSCTTTLSTCTITGLTNDTAYEIAVVATNAVGTGQSGHPAETHTPQRPAGIPTWASPTAPAGHVGSSYSSVIAASADPTYGSLTYTLTGSLPPGLQLDAATGRVSGMPTVQGSFTFTITATNNSGSEPVELTIVIGAALPVDPQLPDTGSSLTALLIGAVALVIGSALHRLRRRPRPSIEV